MANPRLSLVLSADDKISAKIKEVQKKVDDIKNSSKSARSELAQMQRVHKIRNLNKQS